MRAMDMPHVLSLGKLAIEAKVTTIAIPGLGASCIIRMIRNLIALNHLCEIEMILCKIIQRKQERYTTNTMQNTPQICGKPSKICGKPSKK